MKIKKFNELITEDGSTTASVGSGTAVGSGDSGGGSFTSAMGVSVSGGDSGTSFSTNSNTSGMGAITSPQPSNTPGDVAGSTNGSGDIGANLGNTYLKSSPSTKKKKKEKVVKQDINAVENTVIRSFSDMYTTVSNENLNTKVKKYTYVGLKNKDLLYIYIIPKNTTDAYNIGYIDEDGTYIPYDKIKLKKEDLNKLEVNDLSPKEKLDVENTMSTEEQQMIEDYINNF